MLRAATAGLYTEVDARFSNPFKTDRNAHEAFLLALPRWCPCSSAISTSWAFPGAAVMPQGTIPGAREVFGLFAGAKPHG